MVRRIGGAIFQAVPATANEINAGSASSAGKRDRRQSMPTIPSPGAAQHGLPSVRARMSIAAGSGKASIDPPNLGLGAKPSEIRAAAKQQREKVKMEQRKREKIRQREEDAAIRMQKIKDEIAAIKNKEDAQDEEAIAEVHRERAMSKIQTSQVPSSSSVPPETANGKRIRERRGERPRTTKPTRKLSAQETEMASRDTKDLALEELLAEKSAADHAQNEENGEMRDLGGKTLQEMRDMNLSISHFNMPMDELSHFREKNMLVSTQAAAVSPAPPPRKELVATPTGKLKKVPNRNNLDRSSSHRRVPTRTPSLHVPEMRRRANPRDLMFDEEDMQKKATNDEDEDSTNFSFSALRSKVKEAEEAAKRMNQERSKQANGTQKQSQTQPPSSPNPASGNQPSDEAAPSSPSKESKGASSMIAARMARENAKREEDKQKQHAQKAELERAREHFDIGHDLCWKGNDSAGALVDYRKALFIRESLLGKYHEETGRSYFWIGKSLTKLREHEEALMAFSRSMRIFERVLKKKNKYNIWATTAVESVFRQMDDPDMDFQTYKESLEASIRHEQSGDQLRKRGKQAEAIADYREAIDNLDEYHPDAADLYCKIAIILRQQGEFERALEEYRYASEIYELSLGTEHPHTVKTLNELIEKKRLNQKSLALMEKLKLKK